MGSINFGLMFTREEPKRGSTTHMPKPKGRMVTSRATIFGYLQCNHILTRFRVVQGVYKPARHRRKGIQKSEESFWERVASLSKTGPFIFLLFPFHCSSIFCSSIQFFSSPLEPVIPFVLAEIYISIFPIDWLCNCGPNIYAKKQS